MLQAVETLTHWSVPEGMLIPVWNYAHRFERYRSEYGLLDVRDVVVLNALTATAGPLRPAHGDLLSSNVLNSCSGVLTGVLDWEFTGLFLPGLDAAMVWLVLGKIPTVQARVERFVGDEISQQAGFWVNVATLCVRELRTHAELPDGPLRPARLRYLAKVWRTARARIHDLAAVL